MSAHTSTTYVLSKPILIFFLTIEMYKGLCSNYEKFHFLEEIYGHMASYGAVFTQQIPIFLMSHLDAIITLCHEAPLPPHVYMPHAPGSSHSFTLRKPSLFLSSLNSIKHKRKKDIEFKEVIQEVLKLLPRSLVILEVL